MTYTEISFPGLGLTLNPPRLLEIGPLKVHFYGLVIALGLVLAVVYALRNKQRFGLREDDLLDGVLWVTPFAILCARAYYVIFEWEQYAADPISVFYIWKGGLAIYGGVIGAAVGVFVFCRLRRIRIATALDIVSIGFFIGQAMGRWGNFFNREAFGAETALPWRMGLMDKAGEVIYVHPTFLYESLWNFCGFLLLHFLSKRRKYDGQVVLTYVFWYGLGRAMIEGLRTDSLYWGPFRVSQLLAAVSCVLAAAALIWNHLRPHDPQNLYVNQQKAE